MNYLYYHNPRCSKSRAGLEALNSKKIKFQIKEYLKEPLTISELVELLTKLEMEPLEVIRTKETLFKELELNTNEITLEQWCEIIIENPSLLERPILASETTAKIGRPTENLFLVVEDQIFS